MNDSERHISSELFIPLTDGPRKIALAVLSHRLAGSELAKKTVFVPKKFQIEKIVPQRKGLRTVYTLHLVNGVKLHFDPVKPGLFILNKDKMFARALRLHNVHLDDSVHLLCEPRLPRLHNQLKWIFPMLAAIGVAPHRFGKVFKLDRKVFHQYYDMPAPV